MPPPKLFLKKNGRRCRFFTRDGSPKNGETTTQKPHEQGRTFRFFSLAFSGEKTVASAIIGHEAALLLKNWVWFYSIWQVLFGAAEKKRKEMIGKKACIFKGSMVYLLM